MNMSAIKIFPVLNSSKVQNILRKWWGFYVNKLDSLKTELNYLACRFWRALRQEKVIFVIFLMRFIRR